MRIILLGAPGAGKGTQAQFIMNKYGILRISSGDLLRAIAKSEEEFGKKIKEVMNDGKLISDEIVISLIKKQILKKKYQNNFLLDGFPRTIPQARAIKEAGIEIDYVLELHISDELAIKRISGRRVHAKSGRIYHIMFNPPKTEGKDDITGERLTTRKDDQEEAVRRRLEEYHQVTEPLVFYYRKEALESKTKYIRINAEKTVSEIHTGLEKIFMDYSIQDRRL